MKKLSKKAATVSEALDTRLTCRAFTNKVPEKRLIFDLLEKAKRAPSGGNLQPWKIWVVSGSPLKNFIEDVAHKIKENPMGEGTEYNIYPPNLKEPYESRRREVGRSMYEVLNIPKEDKAGRLNQFKRNFEFFGAPVAIFFAIDRQMQEGQWSDLGMFMQSIMLLAREEGLDTCPQEAWAMKQESVTAFVEAPDEEMLFCGMAIGYRDPEAPINSLRTERRPIDTWAKFIKK